MGLSKTKKWQCVDYAEAITNSILENAEPRYIKSFKSGAELRFNAFWRKGDGPNVSLYKNSAIVKDFVNGNSWTVKDFASNVFSLCLPEFMARYGKNISTLKPVKPVYRPSNQIEIPVSEAWQELIKRHGNQTDFANEWLINERGLKRAPHAIGSGYTNLSKKDALFLGNKYQNFFSLRTIQSKQIVVPIRGLRSDEVLNLFFRSIEKVDPAKKCRVMANAGGWGSREEGPRAFGFPHLIHEFPNLVICEGMADYFAAECLLEGDEKYLPLGASNAGALLTWGACLASNNYKGKVFWVYQLDTDSNGKIDMSGPGQTNALRANKILKTAKISSALFFWPKFLKPIDDLRQIPNDLAQIFVETKHDNNFLSSLFLNTLSGEF